MQGCAHVALVPTLQTFVKKYLRFLELELNEWAVIQLESIGMSIDFHYTRVSSAFVIQLSKRATAYSTTALLLVR